MEYKDNFKIKDLLNSVKEKAEGEAVLTSVSPGQQLIKIVNDELVVIKNFMNLCEALNPIEVAKASKVINCSSNSKA